MYKGRCNNAVDKKADVIEVITFMRNTFAGT